MKNIRLNPGLNLIMADYDETEQAEMTSRLLPDHMAGLTEWHGYGTIAGLAARATYYTTEGDSRQVEDNGGDWGALDWDARLESIDIMTDDGAVVATIDNTDHSTEDTEETEEAQNG